LIWFNSAALQHLPKVCAIGKATGNLLLVAFLLEFLLISSPFVTHFSHVGKSAKTI
jgi:hypothetical protein